MGCRGSLRKIRPVRFVRAGLQGEQTEEVLREFGIAAETPEKNGRDKRTGSP